MSSQVFSITALAFAALSLNACSPEGESPENIPIDSTEEPEDQ